MKAVMGIGQMVELTKAGQMHATVARTFPSLPCEVCRQPIPHSAANQGTRSRFCSKACRRARHNRKTFTPWHRKDTPTVVAP